VCRRPDRTPLISLYEKGDDGKEKQVCMVGPLSFKIGHAAWIAVHYLYGSVIQGSVCEMHGMPRLSFDQTTLRTVVQRAQPLCLTANMTIVVCDVVAAQAECD
jgi:hypothetical protein